MKTYSNKKHPNAVFCPQPLVKDFPLIGADSVTNSVTKRCYRLLMFPSLCGIMLCIERSKECSSIEDIVSLFRAIGESEFYSVMRTKRFSFWPFSAKVKYFANDFEETLQFANKAFTTDIAAVLEIRIRKDTLDKIGDFTHVDTTLFRNGTVEIHPEHLEEFNNSIVGIIHRI